MTASSAVRLPWMSETMARRILPLRQTDSAVAGRDGQCARDVVGRHGAIAAADPDIAREIGRRDAAVAGVHLNMPSDTADRDGTVAAGRAQVRLARYLYDEPHRTAPVPAGV